jgi:hypothetical protein
MNSMRSNVLIRVTPDVTVIKCIDLEMTTGNPVLSSHSEMVSRTVHMRYLIGDVRSEVVTSLRVTNRFSCQSSSANWNYSSSLSLRGTVTEGMLLRGIVVFYWRREKRLILDGVCGKNILQGDARI